MKNVSRLAAPMILVAMTAGAQEPSKNSAAQPLPKTIISVGDSITAGALAGLSRDGFYNPFHLIKILSTLVEIVFKWDVYAAAQDRHLSWATGVSSNYSVKSHALRLAYLHSKQGTVLRAGSVSWSGDSSWDLNRQVNSALEWNRTRSANPGPDYVTVLIGANDVCADSVSHMTSDRDYYNNVDAAITRLVSANPNTKIMISSLPDINSLSGVAKRSRLLGFAPYARCEDIWRKTNLCYTLTRRPAGSLDEHLVSEKVNSINRMLGEITARVNRQTGKQSVMMSKHVFDRKFTDDDISIDCFHPNERGQNVIAQATWNDSFWSKNWNERDFEAYLKAVKKAQRRQSQPSPLFRR